MQSDYLLRVIEEAGRALRALRDQVLGRTVEGPKLKQELASLFDSVGLDLELALRATDDTLMLLIAPTGEVDPTRCWILAESLYLTGLGAHLDGDMGNARAAFDKALPLYRAVEPGAVFYGLEEASDRIAEMERLLGSPN
jgi:hypothetical protein